MNTAVRKILVTLNVILVMATLGAYLAPHVEPGRSFLLPILGLGYPMLILANIIAVCVWLFLRSRVALLSVLTLMLGVGSCSRILNVSWSEEADGVGLKLATFNANFSKPIQFAPSAEKTNMERAFNTYLKEQQDIDILCVQEIGTLTESYIKTALGFPFSHSIAGKTVSIFSKYPFKGTGLVDFQSNIANVCLWADVEIGDQLVRVYTTHLESNRHNGVVPEIIGESAPENISNSDLLGIVRYFQKFSIERVRQAKLIRAHADQIAHPYIICGDFNETPQSHVYAVMKEGLQDTFEERGQGIGSTFGNKIPALRIDHILVDESLVVLDHMISPNNFSDHYLVKANLGL